MSANRRNYPRHPKRLRARFRDQESSTWRVCFTLNVSVTGVFLESARVPRMDRIEIEVEIVAGEPILLVGQVIHGTRVPSRLLRSVKGGFAVMLHEAPPEWYEYCLALDK